MKFRPQLLTARASWAEPNPGCSRRVGIGSVDQSGQLEFSTVITESGAFSFWLSAFSYQLLVRTVDQSGPIEFRIVTTESGAYQLAISFWLSATSR